MNPKLKHWKLISCPFFTLHFDLWSPLHPYALWGLVRLWSFFTFFIIALWPSVLYCTVHFDLQLFYKQLWSFSAVWPKALLYTLHSDLLLFSAHCTMTSSPSLHTALWPLVFFCTLHYDLQPVSTHGTLTSGSSLYISCWPPALLFTLHIDLWFFSGHFRLTSSSSIHTAIWHPFLHTLLWSPHCKVGPPRIGIHNTSKGMNRYFSRI